MTVAAEVLLTRVDSTSFFADPAPSTEGRLYDADDYLLYAE